jgi:trimethylamine--corrinoid protein Co-methyltransferase
MNCEDVPKAVADSYRYYIMLKFGTKPVCGGAYTAEGWDVIKELLVVAAGGECELKKYPISIQPACPSPPLKWSKDICQTLLKNAEYGIPVIVDPMMMSGAGAPVTLEGSLVEHSAEILSALVIHQLKAPGAPFIWGGSPTIMDMREGTSLFGAIETCMLGVGHVQIGKSLGLPTGTALGITDSKLADAQAGLEGAIGIFLAVLARTNFIMGPGMIDFESGQCFEKLLIDSEIIALARHFLLGIQRRERPIALNLFRDADYDGDFLSLPHTLKWFEKEFCFPSRVIDRRNYAAWTREGRKNITQRAREQANDLLKQYKPKEIPEEFSKELDKIMLSAGSKYGMEKLPCLKKFPF